MLIPSKNTMWFPIFTFSFGKWRWRIGCLIHLTKNDVIYFHLIVVHVVCFIEYMKITAYAHCSRWTWWTISTLWMVRRTDNWKWRVLTGPTENRRLKRLHWCLHPECWPVNSSNIHLARWRYWNGHCHSSLVNCAADHADIVEVKDPSVIERWECEVFVVVLVSLHTGARLGAHQALTG